MEHLIEISVDAVDMVNASKGKRTWKTFDFGLFK